MTCVKICESREELGEGKCQGCENMFLGLEQGAKVKPLGTSAAGRFLLICALLSNK